MSLDHGFAVGRHLEVRLRADAEFTGEVLGELGCQAVGEQDAHVGGRDRPVEVGEQDVDVVDVVALDLDDVDRHVLVDDNIWFDLVRAGYPADTAQPSVLWVYKLGTD